MVKGVRLGLLGAVAGIVLLAGGGASAETVELVTYYPAPAAESMEMDRLHTGRATVGEPYSLASPANLPGGMLLVSDAVGIGSVFTVEEPKGALHVVGIPDALDRVLFLPGADTAAAGTPDLRVGIGTASPAATAALQVDSTTGGFLPPRMSTAKRDPLSAPPAGLMIYNTSVNRMEYFNGTIWTPIATGITPQTTLFSARSTTRYNMENNSWENVLGMQVSGVQLVNGDIVRLNFGGAYAASSQRGGASLLRYVFNGTPYGERTILGPAGTTTSPGILYGGSYSVTLGVGPNPGEVPEGTYTIQLQAFANTQNRIGELLLFGLSPMSSGSGEQVGVPEEYRLTVERVRQ